jgi:hypothetical protein
VREVGGPHRSASTLDSTASSCAASDSTLAPTSRRSDSGERARGGGGGFGGGGDGAPPCNSCTVASADAADDPARTPQPPHVRPCQRREHTGHAAHCQVRRARHVGSRETPARDAI